MFVSIPLTVPHSLQNRLHRFYRLYRLYRLYHLQKQKQFQAGGSLTLQKRLQNGLQTRLHCFYRLYRLYRLQKQKQFQAGGSCSCSC